MGGKRNGVQGRELRVETCCWQQLVMCGQVGPYIMCGSGESFPFPLRLGGDPSPHLPHHICEDDGDVTNLHIVYVKN